MDRPIIELVDLTKQYGEYTAVDQLTLSVSRGEIFGLLGPNGAGKSTTILMMLGLTEPSRGSVRVCGIDSTSQPIEVKRKVGYLAEDVGFYDDRTGRENLLYTARLNGIPVPEANLRVEQLLDRVGLAEAAGKKVGKYSRGMRQRLGLADVLVKQPEVIILDEPTLGLDPTGVREFLDLIVRLSRQDGITVLFSSHHLHQMQQVCDRVGLFVRGRLLAQGTVESLARQLFTGSPFMVEVGIEPSSKSGSCDAEWLKAMLQSIPEATRVIGADGRFQIECSKDVTPEIARAIVQSGAMLTQLSRKHYGLDDIYHRYFEGGANYE